MRMNPMRTACGVAQGIRRYTRAKTFTAIGWRWWWRVFRRSPVNLVCGRLCWSAPRVGFSGSRGTSSTTSRQLCEGRIDIRRGHHGDIGAACGVVEASRAGGTATRHRCITSGKVAVYGSAIRCAVGISTHTSVSMAPTPHDIPDSPVSMCARHCSTMPARGRPNGRRGLASGVHDGRRETCGVGTHPARGAAMCFRRDER